MRGCAVPLIPSEGPVLTPTAAPSFGQTHFSGLDLGDARVNRRIIDLADILVAREAESWSAAFADPADARALQRIVNRPQATHASVRATHTRVTLDRMARTEDVVLVLHDTTELDYSGRAIRGLGPIGNSHGRGWECHNARAAVARTGAILGLANQIRHRRVEPAVTAAEGMAGRRDRESQHGGGTGGHGGARGGTGGHGGTRRRAAPGCTCATGAPTRSSSWSNSWVRAGRS
ncbi:hypothetical protein GobsT_48400 [Gemmata obscuriglobus]|uniref:Transposase Tn5-like N-terminal domain-containing protein n=1 Tax=Gemmata obscuriglobus TaxID=114 RepID=A0A2Z3H849_9BACT|nr:transposase DNA-binding-containing protein [Gemmata obscuriglobus]AWM37220.1 hypothetical protein C1280_09405 [Gemmata obscuriglobus]QEG30040.1 hypothetical protein GobsT_48400 [Gemmata obscuriglobus]